MGASWAWARSELRRRRSGALGLVLLIGLSGAVVLAAGAAARRTDSAFARGLERNRTSDVQVQYSSEDDIDEEVLAAFRRHPDVLVASPLYITVAFSDRAGYDFLLVSGPEEALFRDVDRPRVLEGSMPDPTAPDQVLLTPFAARSLDIGVGERVDLGTFSADQFDEEVYSEPAGPVIDALVTGIGTFSYDVADPEFAGVLATPAYFDEHWGEVGGFGPTIDLRVRPGADVDQVVGNALEGFTFDELFLTYRSDIEKKVADGTRAMVVGLSIFAAVAALAVFVASAQALRRRVAETADDRAALAAMGMTTGHWVTSVALALIPLVAGGAVVAAGLSVVGSIWTPFGLAGRAEPSPGLDVDPFVLVVGGLVLVGALTLVVVVTAATVDRRLRAPERTRTQGPGVSRVVRRHLRPPVGLGAAMALDPGAGRLGVAGRSALAGATIGVAGLIAVLAFGSSLDTLVQEPSRSGWNWTLAPDIGEDDTESREALMAVPGVEDVGRLLHRQVIIDGEPMTGIAVAADKGQPSLTILRGRMPVGPREVALGPKLIDRSGVGVGDVIDGTLADGGEVELTVVGEVLFPGFDDDNPFNDGAALAPDAIEGMAHSEGFDQTIVRFEEGVSAEEAAGRVEAALPDTISVYSYPNSPPDVANLDDVRLLPRLLGGFLALLALAAVGHALATSARRHRRDFGIARSIGFDRADVRSTVIAQSVSLVVVGLLVGIPLGVVIGRLAWRAFAEGIGVSGAPTVLPSDALIVSALALASAVLLAVLPGRAAMRLRAAEALRAE